MATNHKKPLFNVPFFHNARLWSGLILFLYVLTHLANHALGLVSLQTMELGRDWFLGVWRNPLGTVALYGALITHVALTLWSLYERRRLRMPVAEAFRVILGLTIPLLLTAHIVGTRIAHDVAGASDTYTRMMFIFWELYPRIGLDQVVLLLIAWVHGSMGLYWWVRLRPWFPRFASFLTALALLVPVLSVLGFVNAGREVSRLAENPSWVAQRAAEGPKQSDREFLTMSNHLMLGGFFVGVGLVLVGRVGRYVYRRRGGIIRITYPSGQQISVPVGFSVLEASRSAGIAHASVCGGRGRCSTCRVRVTGQLDILPVASAAEQRVLRRVGAPDNVRLACQLRPLHHVSVAPLLPVSAAPRDGYPHPAYLAGQERQIVALFADLRSFTSIAEHKLPYDLVFLLNRYFTMAGQAIERSGGVVIQFMGDGVMALFGVEEGPRAGSRQALKAAATMIQGLEDISTSLEGELNAPLRMGIGIHTGPAVVGRMGYGPALQLTAVGDTINVASRLQDLTKQYQCLLVISDPVADRADIDVSTFPQHELTVRNRSEPLTIRTIEDPRLLVPSFS